MGQIHLRVPQFFPANYHSSNAQFSRLSCRTGSTDPFASAMPREYYPPPPGKKYSKLAPENQCCRNILQTRNKVKLSRWSSLNADRVYGEMAVHMYNVFALKTETTELTETSSSAHLHGIMIQTETCMQQLLMINNNVVSV
jgi:hypothetical protein